MMSTPKRKRKRRQGKAIDFKEVENNEYDMSQMIDEIKNIKDTIHPIANDLMRVKSLVINYMMKFLNRKTKLRT